MNSNLNPTANPVVTDNNYSHIDYFLPGSNKEADRRASAKLSKCILNFQKCSWEWAALKAYFC